MSKKQESTFKVDLRAAVEVVSGEPRVFMALSQPACFGAATLILSEKDIARWQALLAKAKTMLETS